MDKSMTDQEQRYLKYVSTLNELKKQNDDSREEYNLQILVLRDEASEKEVIVDNQRSTFQEYKKQVCRLMRTVYRMFTRRLSIMKACFLCLIV